MLVNLELMLAKLAERRVYRLEQERKRVAKQVVSPKATASAVPNLRRLVSYALRAYRPGVRFAPYTDELIRRIRQNANHSVDGGALAVEMWENPLPSARPVQIKMLRSC